MITLQQFLTLEDLTAEKFADEIEVSPSTVRRILGGYVPNPTTVKRIHTATCGRVCPNDIYGLHPPAAGLNGQAGWLALVKQVFRGRAAL